MQISQDFNPERISRLWTHYTNVIDDTITDNRLTAMVLDNIPYTIIETPESLDSEYHFSRISYMLSKQASHSRVAVAIQSARVCWFHERELRTREIELEMQ